MRILLSNYVFPSTRAEALEKYADILRELDCAKLKGECLIGVADRDAECGL